MPSKRARKPLSPFQQAVLTVVRIVPPGRVMSYGQVAAHIGAPRAARQVGWALHAMEGTPDFPWWRIVNNTGLITIKNGLHNSKDLQADLLRSEGIEVDESLRVNINSLRHMPSEKERAKLRMESPAGESHDQDA